jgi:hypothetical protein
MPVAVAMQSLEPALPPRYYRGSPPRRPVANFDREGTP